MVKEYPTNVIFAYEILRGTDKNYLQVKFGIVKLIPWNTFETFFSLKRLKGFDPYGWTNARQRHLTSVGFAERAI